MTQLPYGKQSEQTKTKLKRLRGVRLEEFKESKENQNKLVTLCRKNKEMHQTKAWTLSDGGR
jgi:hypothetical protein